MVKTKTIYKKKNYYEDWNKFSVEFYEIKDLGRDSKNEKVFRYSFWLRLEQPFGRDLGRGFNIFSYELNEDTIFPTIYNIFSKVEKKLSEREKVMKEFLWFCKRDRVIPKGKEIDLKTYSWEQLNKEEK